jgi:hypothetical protein
MPPEPSPNRLDAERVTGSFHGGLRVKLREER